MDVPQNSGLARMRGTGADHNYVEQPVQDVKDP